MAPPVGQGAERSGRCASVGSQRCRCRSAPCTRETATPAVGGMGQAQGAGQLGQPIADPRRLLHISQGQRFAGKLREVLADRLS